MATPSFKDWMAGSAVPGGAAGLEKLLAIFASIASGISPDGTTFAPGGTAGIPVNIFANAFALAVSSGSPGQAIATNQAATGITAGVLNEDNNRCRGNHTLVTITGTGVTASTVQLQGTLDNANWFNIGTALSNNAASTVAASSFVGFPTIALRANVTTLTGGTITVQVGSSTG